MKINKHFRKIFRLSGFMLIVALVLTSCESKKKDRHSDTPTTGSIQISVDETFQPIIESEIPVFESIYSQAKIKSIYEPEVDAFNNLLKDSVRLIIVSRRLNQKEKNYFASKQFLPKEVKIALDGIAIISNKHNPDTLLTMNQLKGILSGQITSWKQLHSKSKLGQLKAVFDNKNSSTIRFVVDSICHTGTLGKNLSALQHNKEVLDYVEQHPNAIGLIGVSWISDPNDSSQLSFLKKVNVMSISREDVAEERNSYPPLQAYINDGRYPLTRSVWMINSDPHMGLAAGFLSFVASQRGQRIILKTGIVPFTMPVRVVKISG
ncbi:MAG: substrate-binding domain-containing protein [Bacteroidota bacterium]|nr:substrate-binding domain-containing protein [Bacteroidota bacterium]